MGEVMKAAIVSLDFEGLAELLFGKGTRIRNARQSFTDHGYSCFDLVIQRDDFEEIAEGLMLPRKTCVLHSHADGTREIEFVDTYTAVTP
jgi:hypothetical protein